MTKPKTPKVKPAASSTTPAEAPKKKKSTLKITHIGPVALGEKLSIDVKHIKQGEKVIIDTTGKGSIKVGKLVVTGGVLQFAKTKEPIELKLTLPAASAQSHSAGSGLVYEGGTSAPMK